GWSAARTAVARVSAATSRPSRIRVIRASAALMPLPSFLSFAPSGRSCNFAVARSLLLPSERSIPGGQWRLPRDDLPQLLGLPPRQREGRVTLVLHDDAVGSALLRHDRPDARQVDEEAPVDTEVRSGEKLLQLAQRPFHEGPSVGGPRVHQLALRFEPNHLRRIEQQDLRPAFRGDALGGRRGPLRAALGDEGLASTG